MARPRAAPSRREEGPGARVQAFATDWGAEVLKKNRIVEADGRPWLDAGDPPLLTCHNDPAGALPPRVVTLDVKNAHVPSGDTPAKTTDGRATTWRGRTLDVFDRHVKDAPAGAAALNPAAAPPTVRAGRITTRERAFAARVGQRLEVKFGAERAAGVAIEWAIAGKPGTTDDAHNPPRLIPAFAIDPQTGLLTGTPDAPGTCVFLVATNARDPRSPGRVDVDAISVTVKVTAAGM